jgi:TonB family protein
MGMNVSKVVCMLALAFGPIVTNPSNAAVLAPTGKWVVDYEEQACVATRQYGTEAKPLFLALKPSPMGDVMQLSIIRKGNSDRLGVEEFGHITFDQRQDALVSMLSFGSRNGMNSTRINLSGENFAVMRSAGQLRIHGSSLDETLVLQQFPELMKQIDACVVDLQAAWNMGTGAPSKIKTRARGSLVGLFNSADYPEQSLMKMEHGAVAVVLLINEAGKVADCVVTATSGVAALDAQACAIIAERAKFTPAIGFDGKPTRDSFVQRVNWR